jgi:hypothetical protein
MSAAMGAMNDLQSESLIDVIALSCAALGTLWFFWKERFGRGRGRTPDDELSASSSGTDEFQSWTKS